MEAFLNLMVPDDSVCFLSPIATLVFMDLETTGLPHDVGRKNVHITELSMVAIDRRSFETDNSCRVVNKLSICVRPRANISFGAMDITGLYDDMLETQSHFDKTIPPLIKNFFKRLRSPICLLAHNGKKFDFPLLQAELKRIKCSLEREILCADTIEAFKSIISSLPSFHEQNGHTLRKETIDSKNKKVLTVDQGIQTNYNDNDTSISDDEIDKLLSTDIEFFKNVDMFDHCANQIIKEQTPVRLLDNVEAQVEQSTSVIPRVNGHKPKFTSFSQNNPMPAKRKLYFSDANPSKMKREIEGQSQQATTSNGHTSGANGRNQMRFTLDHLYEYFFNKPPPKSHHAEADCITLREVCQKVSHPFLKWVDENSVAFCDTKAMW